MRIYPTSFLALAPFAFAILALPACTEDRPRRGGEGGEGGEDSTTTTTTSATGTGGGAPEAPHALGVITLGESHASKGGEVVPLVSAFFIPNIEGANGQACGSDVAGCRVSMPPVCASCNGDEYCAFDKACAPACQKICSAACAPDEECYFPSPDTPGCRKKESFDAGALAFSGTTVPITLFPPYSYMGMGSGAPFLEGNMITVQASGASAAGFEKFDAQLTATTFIQTSPPLADIGLSTVLGKGDIPVSWVPGAASIVITASVTAAGSFGTVTCKASDATGTFQFPRAAIDAAADGNAVSGVALSIARTRTDVKKDLKTKGMLSATKVEAVGWVNLVTTSSESANFSCSFGEVVCGATCADVQYDDANCGDCGKKCNAVDSCDSGLCVGDFACNQCINKSVMPGGACKSTYDACQADVECKALDMCVKACGDQTCINNCASMHSTGIAKFQAIGECGCTSACSDECAQSC